MPTLGELQATGWHGITVFCRGCNWVTILLWIYLKQPASMDYEALRRRMVCRRCGQRPEPADVAPYYLDTTRADPRSAPPGVADAQPDGAEEGG